jgi:peptidoglycan/xylan/chitin deacetylase (PgdA/CDA1 family)
MRRLTLTFDNGPSPGTTEHVLDVLARYKLPATFFLVGNEIQGEGRRTAERIKAAGQRIGNHTMTHGTPLGRRRDLDHAEREIGDTEELIGALAESPPLFRPNGGGVSRSHLLSAAAADYLAHHGYTVVTWNSVPRDWEAPSNGWIDRALGDIRRLDWTLLVLHDRGGDKGAMAHLPRFLDLALREATVVGDFPPDCLPMIGGRAQAGLRGIVTPASQ